MPIAITDEQHALRAAIRDWATATNTLADVRAREHRADKPRWWSELTDLGMFAIGVPE
ncbi:MAG TPA: acyl-CoA dehydrogenase family protein [Pseudonocardiaceae bacterium]|nr:acyl-CoA dehydrogenase family protein [Pseudonocardiaceae bacterium]